MSTILTQIIFRIQERARWGRYEWLWELLVFSWVLLTLVRGEGIAVRRLLLRSRWELIDELETYLVGFLQFPLTVCVTESSDRFVGSGMCREFDSHRLHICLIFQACALTTLWMVIFVVYHIIKIKVHSSCEIEDFVETHLCKMCVILRSRALRVYIL